MKVAIVGYGKMGKLIEELALKNGHSISYTISSSNAHLIKDINNSNTDVAIEFSGPETAYENVQQLLNRRIPTVCGSTGWQAQIENAKQLAINKETSFLWASNFSIGVNLFFAFTQHIAQKMQAHASYTPHIHEVHHTAKKDAPSGTAITTAEQVLKAYKQFNGFVTQPETAANKLQITYDRIDPAPGFHEVLFNSQHDTISLQHNAKSRMGFVEGALVAAQFIYNKKGVFTMSDVLLTM